MFTFLGSKYALPYQISVRFTNIRITVIIINMFTVPLCNFPSISSETSLLNSLRSHAMNTKVCSYTDLGFLALFHSIILNRLTCWFLFASYCTPVFLLVAIRVSLKDKHPEDLCCRSYWNFEKCRNKFPLKNLKWHEQMLLVLIVDMFT
jgi:hypothetical protein